MKSMSVLKVTAGAAFAVMPLIPLAAHAAHVDVSLTGNATVLGTQNTHESATNSVETNTQVETRATVSVTPLIFTRESLKTSDETAATSATASSSASSTGSLRMHAMAALSADTNISSVSLSPAEVKMAYHVPAKLFGFISVHVPLTVSVDAAGKTKVSYPWYGFLLSSDGVGLGIRAEAAAKQELASTSSTTATAALSSDMQVKLLEALRGVLSEQASAAATTEIN